MIAPTRRLLAAFLATSVLAAAPSFADERLWTAWLVALLLLAAAFVADLVLLPGATQVESTLDAPSLVYIGDEETAALRLAAPGLDRALAVEGRLEADAELAPFPAIHATVPRTGHTETLLTLRALRRGHPVIRRIWLRWSGPLGLARRAICRDLDVGVRVTPNIRAVRTAALRFAQDRAFQSGLKVERFHGEGSEFDALREFVTGLDPRAIDWKASARHTRLLVRDYRAERDQSVVLAIDTGHLMSEPLAGVPKLDHAVNAALLLAYVSLRTDDRVGLFAFDDTVRTYVAPRSGVAGMRGLQERCAELAYAPSETNFTLALTDLATRLSRRSLVVLFTDFVDSVTAEMLIENAGRLARRHLVLFVTLRDPTLDDVARAEPLSLRDLSRSVVAGDLVRDRDVVLQRLARMGILVLDVAPERLTTSLVNRYLDIKRRELVS